MSAGATRVELYKLVSDRYKVETSESMQTATRWFDTDTQLTVQSQAVLIWGLAQQPCIRQCIQPAQRMPLKLVQFGYKTVPGEMSLQLSDISHGHSTVPKLYHLFIHYNEYYVSRNTAPTAINEQQYGIKFRFKQRQNSAFTRYVVRSVNLTNENVNI